MLDELTPKQFAEWSVADDLGVFDIDGWYQAGTIAAVIHNEFGKIRSMLSREPFSDFKDPAYFVPANLKPKKKKRKSDGIAEAEKQIKRMYQG